MEHQIQFIAITFNDGSIGIMQFILDPNLPENTTLIGYEEGKGREATDEAIQSEIDKSSWGELSPVAWRRIEKDEIPQDRYFRNAWKDTGQVEIDMQKAREIQRDELRIERKPHLEQLDVEYMKATEIGDKQQITEIAEIKQLLRDVTKDPRIEEAETPEELKALTLEELLTV